MKNTNYEIKEKIVKSGDSKVFKNWHEFAGITEEKFLEGLKWLCEPETTAKGREIRALGCLKEEGIIKLKRVYSYKDTPKEEFAGFYRVDNGFHWYGDVTLSPKDRI